MPEKFKILSDPYGATVDWILSGDRDEELTDEDLVYQEADLALRSASLELSPEAIERIA